MVTGLLLWRTLSDHYLVATVRLVPKLLMSMATAIGLDGKGEGARIGAGDDSPLINRLPFRTVPYFTPAQLACRKCTIDILFDHAGTHASRCDRSYKICAHVWYRCAMLPHSLHQPSVCIPVLRNPKPLVLLLPVNLLFRSLLTRAPKNAGNRMGRYRTGTRSQLASVSIHRVGFRAPPERDSEPDIFTAVVSDGVPPARSWNLLHLEKNRHSSQQGLHLR